MSVRHIRRHSTRPSLIKHIVGALPLALKRHLLYLRTYGRWGNFRSPRLFSEKMQWRIINDRRERLKPTCDKRAAKDIALHIARANGLDLRIPRTLAWEKTREEMMVSLIELKERGELPHRWVLKPNNSSGHVVLIEGEPEWVVVARAMESWPRQRGGVHWIWPYAVADAGLIAEEWLGNGEEPPIELAATMVGGDLSYWWVQQEGHTGFRRSHFDASATPVTPWSTRHGVSVDIGDPKAFISSAKPYLEALAEGWDLIRIDLYYAAGAFWFGEFTPYQSDGLNDGEHFHWFDQDVGQRWSLPSRRRVQRGEP